MERKVFDKLVIAAIESLPHEFRQKLDNVDVVVEDLPSSSQQRRSRLKSSMQLLGLYEGIPQTERGTNYTLVLPDKITIFQKSVEAICATNDQIKSEIQNVVKHEIAHHFGISDATLRQIEKNKRRGKS
jgi:predicted Zn-dependent protease with MMP-like domain